MLVNSEFAGPPKNSHQAIYGHDIYLCLERNPPLFKRACLAGTFFMKKGFHFHPWMDFIVWEYKKYEKSHCYSMSAFYAYVIIFCQKMKNHFRLQP